MFEKLQYKNIHISYKNKKHLYNLVNTKANIIKNQENR